MSETPVPESTVAQVTLQGAMELQVHLPPHVARRNQIAPLGAQGGVGESPVRRRGEGQSAEIIRRLCASTEITQALVKEFQLGRRDFCWKRFLE
jgi:hypothetical protein